MKRLLKHIILSFLVAVILLFVIELYLRGGRIVERSFTDFDPNIGRVRTANKNYILFNEGFGLGVFNKGRYIGPYAPSKKPINEFRIAALGDSYVESFQVFERHHFISRFNDEMNSKGSMMNFGRSGFDIEDMLSYNNLLVEDYSPDLTLYFLSNADFFPRVSDVLIPKILFQGDSLVTKLDDGYETYLNQYLKVKDVFTYSCYLNMMNNCYKQYRDGHLMPSVFDKFYTPTKIEGTESISQIPKLSDEVRHMLRYLSIHEGAIIVNRSQEDFYPEIQLLIDSLQIPFIDLKIPLDSLSKSGIDPSYWHVTNQHGHWNHAAHHAIGEYLARELIEFIEE